MAKRINIKKTKQHGNSHKSSPDDASSRVYLDAQIFQEPSYQGNSKLQVGESNPNIERIVGPDQTESNNTYDASYIERSRILEGARLEMITGNKKLILMRKQYNKPVNPEFLMKSASTYELERFEKKLLIIFNHKKFNNDKVLSERIGTEKDVEALSKIFRKFGFEIQVHDDFTKKEVMGELKQLAEKDFSKYGCVCVAVLTHGSEPRNDAKESKNSKRMVNLWAKDKQYSEWDIIECFKMKSLLTKPKILLVQACRGTDQPDGVIVKSEQEIFTDSENSSNNLVVEHYGLPIEADMLILHSGYMGYPTHRQANGTWFVQALCKIINEQADSEDLESIMTAVKREVAINKSGNNSLSCNKQMPVVTSTLIRKLYLRNFSHSDLSNISYWDKYYFKHLIKSYLPILKNLCGLFLGAIIVTILGLCYFNRE